MNNSCEITKERLSNEWRWGYQQEAKHGSRVPYVLPKRKTECKNSMRMGLAEALRMWLRTQQEADANVMSLHLKNKCDVDKSRGNITI